MIKKMKNNWWIQEACFLLASIKQDDNLVTITKTIGREKSHTYRLVSELRAAGLVKYKSLKGKERIILITPKGIKVREEIIGMLKILGY